MVLQLVERPLVGMQENKGVVLTMNKKASKISLTKQELKAIRGGSAVGILNSTLTGATAGVKVCSSGGPYAMAACGVGGALLGAGFGAWTGA